MFLLFFSLGGQFSSERKWRSGYRETDSEGKLAGVKSKGNCGGDVWFERSGGAVGEKNLFSKKNTKVWSWTLLLIVCKAVQIFTVRQAYLNVCNVDRASLSVI